MQISSSKSDIVKGDETVIQSEKELEEEQKISRTRSQSRKSQNLNTSVTISLPEIKPKKNQYIAPKSMKAGLDQS